MSSELAGARKLVDSSYHGYYTPERQRFQDDLVTDLVENNGRSQQAPVLLPLGFTEVLGRVQPLVEGGVLWASYSDYRCFHRDAPRFTAGAMGVGKTFVLHWLRDKGILPVSDFVKINPDKLAKQLPEWVGSL